MTNVDVTISPISVLYRESCVTWTPKAHRFFQKPLLWGPFHSPREHFHPIRMAGFGATSFLRASSISSVVQWHQFVFPFLLVAAPLEWSKPQKGFPFFSPGLGGFLERSGSLKWVWLKINQEGQTAGFGPCFHLPGQPILEFRFLEPQPNGEATPRKTPHESPDLGRGHRQAAGRRRAAALGGLPGAARRPF